MAGDAVVGALRVVLGMDTGSFEDGLKQSASRLQSFGQKVTAIAAGIGLEKGIEKFVENLVHSIKTAIESADQLNKSAQKFGIPVEQLSALSHVADLADVSMETLGKSFGILSKNMESVAGGAANITAAAFSALSIRVKDANGNLKTSTQIFSEVADKFSTMEDGASKTALAIAIFGRAGAELIPLLNQGAKGIEKQSDEFRKMGIVVDTQTAAAAERFNDNLKLLGKTKDAIILKITAGMLPSLDKLSESLVHAANDSEALESTGQKLGKTLEYIATWAGIAAKAFDILTLPVQALFKAGAAVIRGDFQAALDALTPSISGIADKFLGFLQSVKDAAKPADLWAEAMKAVEASMANLNFQMGQFKDKGPLFSEKQFQLAKQFDDAIAKLALDTRVLRGDFANLAPGFVEQAQHFKDLAGFGTTLDALTPKQQQLNAAMMQFRAAQITQETLPIWDQYTKQIEALNGVFASGNLSLEAYGRKSQLIAQSLGLTWQQQSASVAGSLSEITTTFAGENKQMLAIAKTLSAAQALISTFAGSAEALKLPFPFNLAASAAVLAKGLALVAAIKGVTGFATGGSFKVGGSGGIDSQMVSFKATPGEMVDVKRPDQLGSGGEITVRGIRGKDLFTGDMLRDMIEAINAGHKDGYRLKLAD